MRYGRALRVSLAMRNMHMRNVSEIRDARAVGDMHERVCRMRDRSLYAYKPPLAHLYASQAHAYKRKLRQLEDTRIRRCVDGVNT